MHKEAPYTGMMMDCLIASVQKAEAQAMAALPVEMEQLAIPAGSHARNNVRDYDFTYDHEQLLGVA